MVGSRSSTLGMMMSGMTRITGSGSTLSLILITGAAFLASVME